MVIFNLLTVLLPFAIWIPFNNQNDTRVCTAVLAEPVPSARVTVVGRQTTTVVGYPQNPGSL